MKTKTNLCFFDDFWIDCRKNISRKWNTPALSGTYQDPAFDLATYPSLAWCPEAGVYRMWYEALVPDGDGARYLGLCESIDGRNWIPSSHETGDVCNGEHKHFIYSGDGGISASGVYRDPYEKNSLWRYKCVGMTGFKDIRQQPRGRFPLRLSTSPDGVHWTHHPHHIIHPFTSDTYNRLFFNPSTGKYQLILRAGYGDRRICMMESEDLADWSEPALIVHPDTGYEDGTDSIQLYGMGAYWNEGMTLGLMMRFHTSLIDGDLMKMNGYMDTELMYSYDGRYWMHTTRRPMVEKPSSPDYGYNQLCVLDMTESADGNEMILTAAAMRTPHLSAEGYDRIRDSIGGKLSRFNFYAIRKDGFCGLECCGLDGRVITKPFLLEDDDLTLNIAAATGIARFAILDDEGRPYPGFSLSDSQLGSCDGVAVAPCWQDHSLGELIGRRVRFCVDLTSGALYSIRGTFRPFIRRPQVSISNPLQMTVDQHDGLIYPTIKTEGEGK